MRTFTILCLLFAASCHSLAVQRVEKIPKLSMLLLTVLDPPSLQVHWGPVKSADENDPVIGYKVRVLKLHPIELVKYKNAAGVNSSEKELIIPNIREIENLREDAMETIFLVPDPLASNLTIPDVKTNVIYEINVQAFSNFIHTAPKSDYMRIQLVDRGTKIQSAHANEYTRDFVKANDSSV